MGITPYKEAAKPTGIVRLFKRRACDVYRLSHKNLPGALIHAALR
jgi:hypothetical protein